MIELSKPVQVGLIEGNIIKWRKGVCVGRTIESSPRYDVRMPDGSIESDIPEERVRDAA